MTDLDHILAALTSQVQNHHSQGWQAKQQELAERRGRDTPSAGAMGHTAQSFTVSRGEESDTIEVRIPDEKVAFCFDRHGALQFTFQLEAGMTWAPSDRPPSRRSTAWAP